MVWLKSCQRCGGDLYGESDQFGSYVSCFQCGASVANVEVGTAGSDDVKAVELVVAEAKSACPTPLIVEVGLSTMVGN